MRFHSKPIEEHDEVPLADDGRLEESMAHWARRRTRMNDRSARQNACYVVSVGDWDTPTSREAQLAEIVALVRAQGDQVVGHESYHRARPDPRTYLGRGACQDIAMRASACGADLLVVDAELSPSQMRNLEDASGFAVSDREAVILNVFARHARTRKARIQVEIAHLEYLRPRIRGLGLDMDQQAGGMMYARGPGETASELLARRLDDRLAELRKAFARLARAETTQRKDRDKCARIALVGYTNAGKTSLMNALTQAGLSARDMPFETLDTTSRCLTRHGGDVLISDTVGFIRRLPERLLGSFESTLAEIREASLLVLVVDVSDPEYAMHLETTEVLLGRLDAHELPRFYVFNKLDRLRDEPAPAADALAHLCHGHPFVLLSTRDGDAVAALEHRLLHAARSQQQSARVFIPYRAADLLARVYKSCRVLESEAAKRGMSLVIAGPLHVIEGIADEAREQARAMGQENQEVNV